MEIYNIVNGNGAGPRTDNFVPLTLREQIKYLCYNNLTEFHRRYSGKFLTMSRPSFYRIMTYGHASAKHYAELMGLAENLGLSGEEDGDMNIRILMKEFEIILFDFVKTCDIASLSKLKYFVSNSWIKIHGWINK